MENYINKVIQGDALEVLKTIPSDSVDCIITSPPYNKHSANRKCGKTDSWKRARLRPYVFPNPEKEWSKWYKYASENMLFDVDETLTIDAMSDEHWNSFMEFLADEVLKVVVEKIEELPAFTSISDKCMGKVSDEAKKPRWGTNYLERETVLNLLSNLSTNKENKNNG